MSSRQSLARMQSIATSKSPARARNQARAMCATMNRPAACVTNGTVQLDSTEAVIEQDGYFLVASTKFAGRYYVVQATENGWITSSQEARFQATLIAKVEEYINALPQAA